jgi:repressor LexA
MEGSMICENVPLTDKQKSVYQYVRQFCLSNGYCPSVRDICQHFGFRSPNGAHSHLRALKRKGWLDWHPNQGRTLRPSVRSEATHAKQQ